MTAASADEEPPRTRLRERWAKAAAKSRVVVSMALAVAACWLARPTPVSVLVGLPLALTGIALRAWASGHLRKNQQLAVSGPYAHVRNPLYIGSLLAGVGFGVGANHPGLLVAILIVFAFWFLPVVAEEEDHMRKILPGFKDYESRVPRFLPALSARYRSGVRFDPGLYLVNREYSALLGFAAFALVLLYKLAIR